MDQTQEIISSAQTATTEVQLLHKRFPPRIYDALSITPKQSAFIDEFINNGQQASLAYRYIYQSVSRGKSITMADRLLALPHIQSEINKRLLTKAKLERIDKTEVLKKIYELYDAAKSIKDLRTQHKCLELIANMGNLLPKSGNNLQINTQVNNDTYKVTFGDPLVARQQAEEFVQDETNYDDVDFEEPSEDE